MLWVLVPVRRREVIIEGLFVDFLEHSGHVHGFLFALLAELETAFIQNQLEVKEFIRSKGVPGELVEAVEIEKRVLTTCTWLNSSR